jgi:hypothetical protein
MKRVMLVTAACLLAASAFAQTSVNSSSGASVSSGTGVVVTPGVPSASVTVTPSTVSTGMPNHHLLPGGTMVQSSSTTVLGGPAPGISGSKTEITTYWANVPADAARDGNFQRWQQLK